MSNFAFARDSYQQDLRRVRLRRQGASARRFKGPAVPWSAIPVATAHALPAHDGRGRRANYDTWALIGVVITAHALFAWYAGHARPNKTAQPLKSEVSVQLERPKPPEPPKPKVEPPKPPPPKPQRPAQVLPQIEQAAPAPSDQPAVSNEPPVAVAPIASAPPAPPPPAPVTAPFGRAGYLNNPAPDYPPVATRLGWEGTVVLRVRVLSNGKVSAVEVQTSSGHQPLDDAAAATVKKWSFTPSKRGDTPIDGWATVPIEFKLDQ